MTPPRPGLRILLLIAIGGAALTAACGKKGPPLPPLARVPVAPANPLAIRMGDDVYVSFTVPAANVSGQTPADIASVDLYAVTSMAAPSGADPTQAAVKIGSYPVHPPLPPLPEGAPVPPVPPGFVQGAAAVVLETLTAETREITVLPGPVSKPRPSADEPDEPAMVSGPLVAPPESALRRHYFLIAVSPRGRESAASAVVSVAVGDATEPPAGLRLEYTEAAMVLSWEPSVNARPEPPKPEDTAVLPSRPIVAPPAPTRYHVFEVAKDPSAAVDPFALTRPAPVTPEPQTATTFAIPGPVRYGQERCFVVRAIDVAGGAPVASEASAPACQTPIDTFPPAAPRQLAAIAGVGVINLIWEPNAEADLAGYIVLRGTAPGDTLQALTPTPIRETTYRDQAAAPGVRYVYAVVAVDTASPQNVSGQSNRVEESSRTPH